MKLSDQGGNAASSIGGELLEKASNFGSVVKIAPRAGPRQQRAKFGRVKRLPDDPAR